MFLLFNNCICNIFTSSLSVNMELVTINLYAIPSSRQHLKDLLCCFMAVLTTLPA